MKVPWTDIQIAITADSIDQLISFVASLVTIVGVLYLFASSREKKQRIDFEATSTSGFETTTQDRYDWVAQGMMRNRSSSENTIVEIDLVAWKNSRKNSYLRFGHQGLAVDDLVTSGIANPPIRLLGRDARRLQIRFGFHVSGTADESILHHPRHALPSNPYEVVFKDVRGNYFDQYGQLRNITEANLWWTLPNTYKSLQSKNPIPFLRHVGLILISKTKFLLSKVLWSLGL